MKTNVLYLTITLQFLFLSISFLAFPQSQFDFRSVNWGMPIEEVKRNETIPLSKEEKSITGFNAGKPYYDGITLLFENASIGGKNGDLYYEFKNGRLLKIRMVFRKSIAEDPSNISDYIISFNNLFQAFARKEFLVTSPLQCGEHAYFGPDTTNPDNYKIREMKSWGIDGEKIALVSKMINERKYKSAFFRIENKRTIGLMMFFSKYSDMFEFSPAILELAPTFEVEEKIKSLDF